MDVAVLEPRELVRRGLEDMLGRIGVVGRVECHRSLSEMLRGKMRVHEWNPDVIVVSGAHGEGTAARIRRRFPASRVLELVASAERHDLALAATTHAEGYLMLHDTTEANLDRTLHALMHGEFTMPQPVAAYLFECADRVRDCRCGSSPTPA